MSPADIGATSICKLRPMTSVTVRFIVLEHRGASGIGGSSASQPASHAAFGSSTSVSKSQQAVQLRGWELDLQAQVVTSRTFGGGDRMERNEVPVGDALDDHVQ